MSEEFIPLTEQSGFIRPLTSWVFDKALQFDKLEHNGASPERIVFEITESIMMDDIDMSLAALKDLNKLGVKLSIDDFGTEHSSLSYLSQLPVHELKIDRSFVSGMLQQTHNQKIVEMTINLAHTLGLCVVAEGIEDKPTLSHFKSLNCDVAQGYFIGRPMPYDNFVTWLEDNKGPKFTEKKISAVNESQLHR